MVSCRGIAVARVFAVVMVLNVIRLSKQAKNVTPLREYPAPAGTELANCTEQRLTYTQCNASLFILYQLGVVLFQYSYPLLQQI
jgi:hypothetical protein